MYAETRDLVKITETLDDIIEKLDSDAEPLKDREFKNDLLRLIANLRMVRGYLIEAGIAALKLRKEYYL